VSDNKIQTSFAAGELAPSIFARTDLAKYHSGAALMRNFFVDYRSGASTRAGTKFLSQAFKSATAVRLIPFQYSVLSSYILEFGDKYVRFYSNGASVLEAAFAITGATQAFPCILTVVGNNFVVGDWIFVTGVLGMTQLNGRYFLVTNVSGSQITIADVNGNAINAINYTAYTSGGTASRVYTLVSPYAATDLALLKFTQSASVMTITHPSYAPQNLTQTAPTNWSFTTITFATPIAAPTGLATIVGTAGSFDYAFVVTAIDANGNESIASTPIAANSSVNLSVNTGTIRVTWSARAGAVSYNVYMSEPSIVGTIPSSAAFGFVGTAFGTTFDNTNILPNFTITPPIATNPFASANNPMVNVYHQQRQTFLGSAANPTTFWMGTTGGFTPTNSDFNVSNPLQDDDAITGNIVSLQVNAIKSALSMPGGLIVLTAKGAWQVTGGGGSALSPLAITPINATATPQAYNGASDVPPIVVNYDILYVQAKGAIVRDLSYNLYAQIYTGMDISILSNHLFFGHQITQWAYAEEPFKVIWAVRDDGILLSLTYVKDQEIIGWAHHDTLGLVQSVATVTEGQVDAIYLVVKRFIGGQWLQFIERMADRTFAYGAEDSWCLDCAVQSALVTPAANLTISGTTAVPASGTYPLAPLGGSLVATGTATFTADAPVFATGNVGSILRVGGGIATITTYISPTILIGTITQPITAVLPNDPLATPVPATSGNWSLTPQSTVFSGLDYLNGQTVSILADGGVVAPQQVVNNTITLAKPASKVLAGLPFTAQLQTMPLDTGEPTIQGKRKKVAALTIRARETRGLEAGRTFATTVPLKELTSSVTLNQSIPLITGDERVVMDPLWDVPGQICVVQKQPLPATVLGVIPEIVVGDR
jgi:hypothetical protein